MARQEKIYLDKTRGSIPRYQVMKLVNLLVPDIGSYLEENEVENLMQWNPNADVIIKLAPKSR